MFCNVGGVSRDCVNMGTVVDNDVVIVIILDVLGSCSMFACLRLLILFETLMFVPL